MKNERQPHPLGPWLFYQAEFIKMRDDIGHYMKLMFVRRDGKPNKDYQMVYVWAPNTVVAVRHILFSGEEDLTKFNDAVIPRRE